MREVEWDPDTKKDLLRIGANHRSRIYGRVKIYLSQVPPHGANKSVDLDDPWGPTNQLSIDEFRVLYDVYPEENLVYVLVVMEKASHIDTKTALNEWLGPAAARRRRKP